jgi:hypothetical protein
MTQVCNLNALKDSSFSDLLPLLVLNFHHFSSKSNLFTVFKKCPSMDHQGQPRDQSKFRMTNGAKVLV